MQRRRFVSAGTALAAALGAPSFLRLLIGDEASASQVNQIGARQPFDYAWLKGAARALAAAPYKPPKRTVPPVLSGLSWDRWQSIRFRKEKGLWAGEDLPFAARFFHLGYTMTTPVRLYSVRDGSATEIAYNPNLFDYGDAKIDPRSLPPDLGFAGFNLFSHTDWTRDRAAFQGASYFRAVDGGRQYGMSQRGLAVNCGMATPEEFPDFIAYYLERPLAGSNVVTIYGLLDSPSVSGAYRFVITMDDMLTMDIDAALYPRQTIERVGIAPGTSMFFYGKNDRRVGDDWRPEIHDSDGLQMWTGAGEWIWRPLVNPRVVRVNTFADEQPRGFGLIQRERSFDQYQDDSVFYEKRPNVWVQPSANWGKGSVMLVEIPTRDETSDNIVAFWSPEQKPQPGQECLFGYKLFWGRDNPFFNAGRVLATRTGVGGIIGKKRSYFSWRFVVDFVGGNLGSLGEKAKVVPMITVSRGRVETVSARTLSEVNGWRAIFDFVPPDESTEPVNLRMFLSLDGQALSETWLYQYEPPVAAERDKWISA